MSDAEDPKTELCDLAGFLGSSSDAFVDELLKTFRGDAGPVRRVLESAKAAAYPTSYINKVITAEKATLKTMLNRDVLDQKQIDSWAPVRGQYPEIDYMHPEQPYFIRSEIDRKKLYLDWRRVEELVNSQRNRLGLP